MSQRERKAEWYPAGESGQVLIVTAFALVGIFGFLGLVVDVGQLYLARARAMNAAEAATAAGVHYLPSDPTNARAIALQYAATNGVPNDHVTVTISPDDTKLTVETRLDVNMIFARIFGLNSSTVKGRTKAQLGAISALSGARPFGVEQQAFVYGGTYYLKNSPGYGGSYKGNFGCLALGGNGADTYRTNINNGYQGELKIGDTVQDKPGNNSGPTTQGIDDLLNADPTGTYDKHNPDSPRIIKVPVVTWNTERSVATVVGFAAFWLEGVGGEGNENYIAGRFMKLTDNAGAKSGSEDGSSYDYGLYSYRFIE